MSYSEQILQPVFYDLPEKNYWDEEEKIDHGATGYGV